MKPEEALIKEGRGMAYLFVVLATLSIVGLLVLAMIRLTQPAATTAARVEERQKNLRDLRAANVAALQDYAWQDQAKGIVRLPIEKAMELAVKEWQNPVSARTNLLQRHAKATFVPPPPPKAPEKPSVYE